eukprot:m.113754 g.113754  ORF g.113754 m.113754 type:complete len:589 (+) comp9269_c0_seq7:39-1805(+)
MSSFSTFPELEGIAFPASSARELAEKKVLKKRAIAAEKQRQEDARIKAEESALAAKRGRIEAKRIAAEKRLLDLAKQRALEDEMEAEKLILQKKEREADVEARRKQQVEDERILLEKQKNAEVLRKKQNEAERQHRIQEEEKEKQRRRQAQLEKKRIEEKETDLRWLRTQTKLGNVRVVRENGIFIAYPQNDSIQMESLPWLQYETELHGIKYEEIEVPIQEDEKPKFALVAPRKSSSSTTMASSMSPVLQQRWNGAHSTGPAAVALRVVKEFQLKSWKNFNTVSIDMLANNLDGTSSETKFEALLLLYSFFTTLLVTEGKDGFKTVVEDDTHKAEVAKLPRALKSILDDSPGNSFAIAILGMLYFSGPESVVLTIEDLKVIPSDFEEWSGWLLGARLFFEFFAWWQAAHPSLATVADWTLDDESFLSEEPVPSKVVTGARKMINYLVLCYLPTGSERIGSDIEGKLTFLYARTSSVKGEVLDGKHAYANAMELAKEEHSSDISSNVQQAWDRQNYLAKDSKRTLETAEQRLTQVQTDAQNAREFLQHADAKKLQLSQKLTMLRQKEESLKRDQEDIVSQLKALNQLN